MVTFSPVAPSFRSGSSVPNLSLAGPPPVHPNPTGNMSAPVAAVIFFRKSLRVFMVVMIVFYSKVQNSGERTAFMTFENGTGEGF
jgi:hypothetical protein